MAAREHGSAPLVFRLHGGAPQVVREVLLERGWEEYDEQKQEEGEWNLYWRTSAFRNSDHENVLPWQRLNHHPKMIHITRKDCLTRHLRRMKSAHGAAAYDFSPAAFILPNEYTKFLAAYVRNRAAGKPRYWICKPVDLSRGRGIFLFDNIRDLTYDSPVIIQRYISKPLLISGYKFDLRIYVCVKSFSPLIIYMHQEGLVRFATEKYNLVSLDNVYAHLTNTSINKFGLCYTTDKERVGRGCKWTMTKFRSFLHNQGVNDLLLWRKISNIVTLTLLTAAPSIPSSPNCLELLGFDILIDTSFKPWLLEVNYSPALSLDCPADVTVKKGLINDIIDLMNYRMIDGFRQNGYLRRSCTGCHYILTKIPPAFLLPKTSSAPRRWQNVCAKRKKQNITFPSIKTTISSRRKQTRIHHGQTSDVSHDDEEINVEVESVDCELTTLRRVRESSRNVPSAVCKLPSLYVQNHKSPTAPYNRPSQDRSIPPSRVGDFILTFPFNEVTWKASRDDVGVKSVVHEIQKLTSRLASSSSGEERTNMDKRVAVRDRFEALLWGPKNPPLLSECCALKSP